MSKILPLVRLEMSRVGSACSRMVLCALLETPVKLVEWDFKVSMSSSPVLPHCHAIHDPIPAEASPEI